MEQAVKECECDKKGIAERLNKVREVARQFKELKGALIPVLHETQDLFGYLPEEAMQIVSIELNIPMAEIFGVATFYSFFSLEPKGEHVIRVCLGTACYVRGSQAVLDEFSKKLNVEVGKTTEDGKFTLEAMRCLGACGLAPVLSVADEVHGKVGAADVQKILAQYE